MDYFKPLTLEEELKKNKAGGAAEVNKRRLSKAPKLQLEDRNDSFVERKKRGKKSFEQIDFLAVSRLSSRTWIRVCVSV